jgi:hypothetical protein
MFDLTVFTKKQRKKANMSILIMIIEENYHYLCVLVEICVNWSCDISFQSKLAVKSDIYE